MVLVQDSDATHRARALLIRWYYYHSECVILSLRSPPLDFYVVQYSDRRRRHTPKEFVPRATKLIFEKVLWKHAQTFSLWQITCVERMLACGTNMMGAKHYNCGTPDCPHTKVQTPWRNMPRVWCLNGKTWKRVSFINHILLALLITRLAFAACAQSL